MSTETEINTNRPAPAGEFPVETVPPMPKQSGLSKGIWMVLGTVALIVLLVIVFGILARSKSEHALEKDTAVAAIPSVNVIYPAVSTLSPEIALPGNTQA
jgi:hypothetical protein